ncbi:MAG: hypothetical protein VX589_14130 [Myxococcota bacterium]|nr:hypothetical protein [Myxococcota bacterium]
MIDPTGFLRHLGVLCLAALWSIPAGATPAPPTLIQQGGACGKPTDCARGLTCAGGLGVRFICVTPQSAICRQRPECRALGMCGALNGACVARSNADCMASVACRTRGLCTLRTENGRPVCRAKSP